jgi:hypothetical protein
MSADLSAFAETNRAIVEALYELVSRFERRLKQPVLEGGHSEQALQRAIDELDWRGVGERVPSLSSRHESGAGVEARSRALHDIRGGAWTGLWGLLQFVESVGPSAAYAREAFWLARDHAKMMRNAIDGIDPERTRRDRSVKLHGVDLLVEKWRGRKSGDETRLEIDVYCEYEGAIAERCLEFSALDRVLYNLLNNARRHSADRTAELWMLPSPPEAPRDVRFVVRNPVAPADKARLEELDEQRRSLFSPEVSSTGSGLGLSIAAEFVANAYGLESPERAADFGHVGAQTDGDSINVWVHWPIVD